MNDSAHGKLQQFRRLLPLTLLAGLLSACGADEPPAAPTDSPPAGNAVPPPQAAAAPAPSGGGAPAPAVQRSADFSGPDMAGLYLGMLPADVEAVFQAMSPSPRTQTTQATFRYDVLGQRRETEPFLSAMHAETTAPGSRILLEVGFAPPPEGGQAVAVRRYHRQDVERIPRALYRDSLVEKYGEPDEEVEADESGTSVLNLVWRIGGGPLHCVDYPTRRGVGETLIGIVLNGDGSLRNGESGSLEDCADFLAYSLREDPVVVAQGAMWRVAEEVRSQQAAQAWVQELVEEGSRPSTQRPSL